MLWKRFIIYHVGVAFISFVVPSKDKCMFGNYLDPQNMLYCFFLFFCVYLKTMTLKKTMRTKNQYGKRVALNLLPLKKTLLALRFAHSTPFF